MFIEENIDKIKSVMEKKCYSFFTTGDYNLNLIGIRKNNTISNVFDDLFLCIFKIHGYWRCHIAQITTDPGLYWTENPMNVDGTAILKPGQYRSSFRFGYHKNKYPALVQCAPVTVYRGRNRDNEINTESEDTGLFGINIHKAGSASKNVDKWSAGCQVFANESEYDFLIKNVYAAIHKWGGRFTYTLLQQSDFGDTQV